MDKKFKSKNYAYKTGNNKALRGLQKERSEVIGAEYFTIKINFFYAKTNKPDEFIDELEQLCRKYCRLDDFSFKYSVED